MGYFALEKGKKWIGVYICKTWVFHEVAITAVKSSICKKKHKFGSSVNVKEMELYMTYVYYKQYKQNDHFQFSVKAH